MIDVVVLELCAMVMTVAGVGLLIGAARRHQRWTAVIAFPLIYAFATTASWLTVEMSWMRSWATRPGAVIDASPLEASRVGDYRIEFHKGQPEVSFETQERSRQGIERSRHSFFRAPMWFVDRATRVTGPVATLLLCALYLVVPRSRLRDGNSREA